MLTTHPGFATPAPDTVIWRYLDLRKFGYLIERSELYFCNVFDLPSVNDPWEGCGNPLTIEQRIFDIMSGREKLPFPGPLQMATSMPVRGKDMPDQHFVSCWHQNDELVPDMWEEYVKGGQGVVVQSTVGRLIESLKGVPDQLYVGAVMYYDRDKVTMPKGAPAWMVKDTKFTWETEVRAVFKRDRKGAAEAFISLPCDLSVLVEDVHLSPTATAETISAVEGLLWKVGLNVL